MKIPKELCPVIRFLHKYARKQLDKSTTYDVVEFNKLTKDFLEAGVELDLEDKIVWARDAMGRKHDHLTEYDATPGTAGALGGRYFVKRKGFFSSRS